jgi:hypothetical protein
MPCQQLWGEWRFDNPVNATGTMTGFAFETQMQERWVGFAELW